MFRGDDVMYVWPKANSFATSSTTKKRRKAQKCKACGKPRKGHTCTGPAPGMSANFNAPYAHSGTDLTDSNRNFGRVFAKI